MKQELVADLTKPCCPPGKLSLRQLVIQVLSNSRLNGENPAAAQGTWFDTYPRRGAN
ncbi:MAG TPA: hypothetical protein VKB53_06490 [Gammaproteobacteria bacterium]|nr:hypothetical protein [Gammaproteobacteria bacterium]